MLAHFEDYNTAQLPQSVDIVFNVLYYHDLSLNKIDTAVVKQEILAAEFELVTDSKLLANPGGAITRGWSLARLQEIFFSRA